MNRIIRFIATDDITYFGEPNEQLTKAYKIIGNIFGSYTITGELLTVKTLLSPLSKDQVGTIRMIGMNYKKHCEEIKLQLPKWPCLFYKPSTAIIGNNHPIHVPRQAQIEGAKIDYESELVVVIGKEGKNIPAECALDYVLGYTIGNDISQRTWQIDRGGSQFNVGKMFDSWAPIGPVITTTNVIKNPNKLQIGSKVNGELRQQSNTSDAIFSVRQLIEHMSMGTTLLPGDIIFTGTPQGVGSGFNPPKWLRNGDKVQCFIQDIGILENDIVFEQPGKL
jgi:2-keto-4-pentenoate hydratase/2-oxohepta-3-ene-1,7-dioic acid hydratase in catechol pathway